MVYFKFYDTPSEKSLKRKSLLVKLGESVSKLFGSILKANPDFDSKIDEVKQWLIEYDDVEFHQAIREIGIDSQDNIIIKMPDNRNYGFWSDAGLTLNDFMKFGISYITEDEFNNLWNSVSYDWKTLLMR